MTPGESAIASRVREAAECLGTLTDHQLVGQAAAVGAGLTLIGYENWQAFGYLAEHKGLGADVRARLTASSRISPAEVLAAETTRRTFAAEIDDLLDRFDILALPTLPLAVPTLRESDEPASILPLTANVRPFNLSGHPAISLPVGEIAGRPVSLQLVGRRGADEVLCALAGRVTLFNSEKKNGLVATA